MNCSLPKILIWAQKFDFVNLKLVKHFDNSLGRRFGTRRVLSSDQAAIDDMEIIPDTG